jgi:uncharacterized protein (TIGR02099 family)
VLKRLFKLLGFCLVTVLFLSAVLLSAVRLWVPSLGEYRNDIAAAASRALNRPVTIRRLDATWRGLSPVLKLRGVTIGSTQEPQRPLDVSEIWVSIDVRHYLATRELQPSGVDVIGVDLTLARDAQGRMYVQQLPADEDAGFGGGLATMSRLSIHDANITIRDLPGIRDPQRFRDVTLSLINRSDLHELSGHALLPGSLGERIEIEAQMQGLSPNPLDWQGIAYFHGKALAMSTLSRGLLAEAQAVDGSADVRLWARRRSGRMQSLSGEIEVAGFSLQQGEGETVSRFDADRLQSQFGWRHATEGWQLALQDLQFRRGVRSWKADNLSLAVTTGQQASYVNASASRLDLAPLAGLLAVLPIDASYRAQLQALQPVGLVEDLSASLQHDAGTTTVDHFDARFIKLGVAQSGAIPALSGLDGTISGSTDGGTLAVDSHAVELHDTRLFRGPLRFDRVQANLDWRDTGEGIVLAGHGLSIANRRLALQGDLAMLLPRGDAASPTIDLQLAVPRAEVAGLSTYLPAKIMSPSGVAWLDRSLVGGAVHDGTVVIQGRLDQLPFDHGEGRLEVRLPVTGATLEFNEHWSPVEQLDAQVDFTGRQMDIRSHAGVMRSAALHNVHAQIRDLEHPRLTITGDVRGDLPVMLAELGSSPLGETYGGFVDRSTTTGAADLALDIVVPLGDNPAPIVVAGRIGLTGNTLRVRDSDIELEQIHGRLDFDTDGIRGDDLTATLFDRPVQVKVYTESGDSVTHIDLHGKLALLDQVLAEGHPLRLAVIDNSDWQVRLTVHGKPLRGKPARLALSVSSTLAGTVVDLPAPLGKPLGTVREVSIRIDNLDQAAQQLQFSYAGGLKGRLVIGQEQQTTRLRRGVLALGGAEAKLPDSNVLLVTGRLETFRLSDWRPYFSVAGDTSRLPVRVSIGIGELELLGHLLRDTAFDIESNGREWIIKGLGPAFEGDIRLTQSAQGFDTIDINLQRLQLERVADAGARQTEQSLSPADLPDIQGTVQQLVYNGVSYGSLDMQAQKKTDGILEISRLAMSSDKLKLRLSGDWRVQEGTSLSHIDVKIDDCDLEWLLHVLGYQELIRDGKMFAELQANWPGAPWSFAPDTIDGKLSVIIKDGQLVDVEPGATGRALGLLSVGMLPKRLSLDFSDLFEAGFGFNRIGGSFVLDSGNAYTNDLEVDGPAAKIDISGRVGLAAQDYDELVTVTPYLQSSLPLAGALAGGPAVGAAVIVAGKLLEDVLGLNKMARKQYAVTGPWAEPVVTQLDLSETAADEDADEIEFEE